MALVLEEGASRPLNVTVTVRRGEVDVASAVLPPTTMDGLSAACVACPAPHKVEVRRWRIERQKLSGSGNVEGAPDVTDLGFDLQAIRKLTQMAEALTKANSAQLFKEKARSGRDRFSKLWLACLTGRANHAKQSLASG